MVEETAMDAETRPRAKIFSPFRFVALWGPGLLVMLADTDAGNVVTAAEGGARWGYRLLPLLLGLIPLLYVTQELTARLGVFTGRGHAELVRERFGRRWAWVSVAGLTVAAVGSLITEFTGIAGVGELFGLPRWLSLSASSAALLAMVSTGSYRRVERITMVIGLFELAFFYVAWAVHPDLASIGRDLRDLPLGDHDFLYLAAALVGAVFSPWMVFYQQSAVAEKKLRPEDLRVARWDTAFGSVLTQLLTAAVLVAAAAAFADDPAPLGSLEEIARALFPVLGGTAGRLVFGVGVLGAALVAAIVTSQALAWGMGEAAGYRRALEYRPFAAGWFCAGYVVCVAGSAVLVWQIPDLIRLNIATQVVNALLLPLAIGFLLALARTALPAEHRLRGWYCWAVVGLSVTVSAIALAGAIGGLF